MLNFMNKRNSKDAILERSNNQIRHNRNCIFLMHCHLVFVTKYRRGVFNKVILKRMEEIFRNICEKYESNLVEFNGEDNHVHLLINYPPKFSISKIVNSLKGVSARLLRKEFGNELKKRIWKGSLWSPSYFAGSCGGAPLSKIKQYIKDQETPEY